MQSNIPEQARPGREGHTLAPNSDHLGCFWQLGRTVRCCCNCSGSDHGHLLSYPNPRGLGDGQSSGGGWFSKQQPVEQAEWPGTEVLREAVVF